jgi:hypothetical protein
LVPGTACDYKLTNCSRRACVLRSPNYPGLYNRNLTCAHHIYVLPGEAPAGRHTAVIAIGGPGQSAVTNRAWLLGQPVEKYGRIDPTIGLGAAECGAIGDSATLYDGPMPLLPDSTLPPALLQFCRGGILPLVVSSGPDMLVVTRSSPFAPPTTARHSSTGTRSTKKLDL